MLQIDDYGNGVIFPLEPGSGGGTPTGILVGMVTNGSSFPTVRPDGSALENEDFVRVDPKSTFPFTIDDVTFNNSKDKAYYVEGKWYLDAGVIQTTEETPLSDKTRESLSGTAATQNIANEEVVTAVKNLQVEFTSLRRMSDYLYEITFDKMPEYIDDDIFSVAHACTSFVRNGKLYRSFDLKYDNTAEFKVVTKGFEGMAIIQGIEDGDVDTKLVSQAPYHLADGVNRNGIMVSEHVLFNDFEFEGTGDKFFDMTLLPFVVLNNLTSIDDIETNPVLLNFLERIKIPTILESADYILQFMVTDGLTTYAITPKEDGSGYEIVDISDNPKMTNFKWVNKKTLERNDADLQDRPTGIERWNSIDDTTELRDLRYTKCYESPTMLSEFIGEDGTNKDSTDEELMVPYNKARAEYLVRERDGKTWQSLHAVEYSKDGMESLYVQESYNINFIPHKEKKYVHYQTAEANEWIINHNLQSDYIEAVPYDENGEKIFGAYFEKVSKNQCKLIMEPAHKGTCVVQKIN